MKMTVLEIDGMSCGHCAMAVKKELTKLAGVAGADVTIGKAEVTADEEMVSVESMKDAVKAAGYSVVAVK